MRPSAGLKFVTKHVLPAEQHEWMVFAPWQLWQPWKKLIFVLSCPSVSRCFFCPNLHFRWDSVFHFFYVKQPSDFVYLWSIMVSSEGLNDSLWWSFLLRARWSTTISCWDIMNTGRSGGTCFICHFTKIWLMEYIFIVYPHPHIHFNIVWALTGWEWQPSDWSWISEYV